MRESPARGVEPSNPFVEFPRDALEGSIPERFEEIVRRYPGRLAVKTRNDALTYDALNRTANRIAHALLARSGGAEEPIALLLEKGNPLIAAILGALKAGRIYVALDPAFPPSRLRAILEDSHPRLLVTNTLNAPFARTLSARALPALNLDELDASLPQEDPCRAISADTIGYIMYTSGSTGRPKGVFHPHRNGLHAAMLHTHSLHICPEDRLSLLYSCSFSASVRNILTALLNGAALFPFDLYGERFSDLATWLIQEGITVFQSAATVFGQFAETLGGSQAFPRLRIIKLGSETVSPRHVELYKAHFSPDCLLHVTLSSNETGSICDYFIGKATPTTWNRVRVGHPVPGKEVLLLDEADAEVEPGEVGEIAVKSRYLAAGYWRRPDLTRAAFRPDPKGTDARLYRTGDLGRWLPDGCLEYVGRTASQVRVRGQTVDLTAIEAALFAEGGVKEVAVVAREDRPGDQRVVAYVVPAGGSLPTASALRQALATALPEHMLPANFVVLDAMPLTPTGKVDRRALPAPSTVRPDVDTPFVAPRDGTEERLTALWARVLGLEQVGVEDNFFDLGGHSLLAAQLFVTLAREGGPQLPLVTLFRAPTVAALAKVLREEGRSAAPSPLVPLQPAGTRPPMFCVHQHTGHLFCYQPLARHLGPDQPVFGLVPPGLDGIEPSRTRIEDMAAAYVQAIRQVQPEGPYHLLGYCFGGVVAFEMAHQLVTQGQAVGLLAFLETFWEQRGGPGRLVRRVGRRLAFEWDHFASLTAPERVGHGLARALTLGEELAGGIVGRVRELTRTPQEKTYLDRAIEQVEAAHRAAARDYVPRVYPGRIVLFRAPRVVARFHGDPTIGWAGLAARGIALEEIPGRYRTVVEEAPARLLAARLRAYLGGEPPTEAP